LYLKTEGLYECKTWSLIVREEYRLKVFGDRVPRRIFRPKMEKATGSWRRLHNEELHNLYRSSDIDRVMK
jgi:hypothetical protein